MRILVTNDDGVSAEGLQVAEAIAETIVAEAGGGEVVVVAPAFEQSGVAHAISFTKPMMTEKLGPRRFAVQGTPADCVILGLYEILKGDMPDLILSGVNRGRNVSEDAVYSGTLGAALEGALHGVKAIGLSQSFDRARMELLGEDGDMFEAARVHGAAAVRRLLSAEWSKDLFFNVNFPHVGADEVKGQVFARQGRRAQGVFAPEKRLSPTGRRYYWLRHQIDPASGGPQDDGTLVNAGYVTIVPMKPDYTAEAELAALQETDQGA